MEWIFNRCNNMEKFQVYYVNWMKSESNGYIIWSHLYDILANGKLQGQKIDQWLPVAGAEEQRLTNKWFVEEFGELKEFFHILIGMVAPGLCTFVQTHRTID